MRVDPVSPRSAEVRLRGARVALTGDVLSVLFDEPYQWVSFAIHNGGIRKASAVAWVGVRNEELSLDLDARSLLAQRLEPQGLGQAVGLLTSRDLDRFVVESVARASTEAYCVGTVGLSNALRVGDPPHEVPEVGTINLLCWCNAPLSELATLEALSIAAEARTAALLEAAFPSRVSGAPATGTGTDCIVVGSPARGSERLDYAGKHTEIGHLLGSVVYRTVARGTAEWLAERRARKAEKP